MSVPGKNNEDWSEGVPTGAEKPWAGKGDMKPFGQKKQELDENGNPLELECLDELIAECLNDFWNFYGGINSKSVNNGLNVTNDELTIRDENGNIIDVNTFASENPELLENVKSMISNTVMAWAEQTIADMENNGENE